MNCKIRIIAMSLLVSSLSAPAWAGLSEPAAAGEEPAGHTLSALENSGRPAGIESFLDRFAGIASSDSSSEGADNIQSIGPISQARAFDTAGDGDRFSFPDAGLAASAQGRSAGSGDKWCDADFGRFHPGASNPGFFQNNDWHNDHPGYPWHPDHPGCPGGGHQSIPLPLPFLLTGSGLAALLALKKKAGIDG